jgi:hypothetical protein
VLPFDRVAGVKLITNNAADFAPYLDDGLAVENWG